jgi:enolase
MTIKITKISALEVLDSRDNPTVRVYCRLDNGIRASAVPSAASAGENDGGELRDGGRKRYNGKGVLQAGKNVNERIAPKLIGRAPFRQAMIDRLMIDLDGTPNKAELGANATWGVSMALARAAAMDAGLPPLWGTRGGEPETQRRGLRVDRRGRNGRGL